jgi:hypothetical protein
VCAFCGAHLASTALCTHTQLLEPLLLTLPLEWPQHSMPVPSTTASPFTDKPLWHNNITFQYITLLYSALHAAHNQEWNPMPTTTQAQTKLKEPLQPALLTFPLEWPQHSMPVPSTTASPFTDKPLWHNYITLQYI